VEDGRFVDVARTPLPANTSVYDVIAEPLRQEAPEAEVSAQVLSVAKRLEIVEFLERHVVALSGGRRQRVALARALALEDDVQKRQQLVGEIEAWLQTSDAQETAREHAAGMWLT
jgi:ABC-type Fe3+/spermidine/putrescine transport system ATPase subunit